jgi:hypothetical protein
MRLLLNLVLVVVSTQLVFASRSIDWEAQENGVRLTFSTDAPVLTEMEYEGRNWILPEIGQDFSNSPTGSPDLPWLTRLVEIPDLSAVQLEVLSREQRPVGSFDIVPVQDRTIDSTVQSELDFAINTEIYQGDTNWPPVDVLISKPVILRNRRMVKISYSPFSWNPASKQLLLNEHLELQLTFAGEDTNNALQKHIARTDGPFDKILQEDLIPLNTENGSVNGIFEQAEFPGTYAVVAKSAVAVNPALVEFLEWKRQKGHVVHIISDAEVGSFTPINIRSAISELYFNDAYPPDYVLLVGDTGNGDFGIPAGDTQYDGEQDHFYSKLDGDDILGDVAVGRLSVTSQTMLAVVIHKIMSYEITPTLAGEEWLHTAAASTGYNAVSMVHLSRSIVHHWINSGYTEIDSLWYSSNSSWVNARFNEGLSQYCYRGWIGMNGVDVSYVNNNSNFNNSYKTPVAAIFTCATGDFNGGTSTTEAFLRKGSINNARGAVAAMGFATAATHTAFNNAVVAGYYGGHHDLGLSAIGPAMFYGKYNLWATLPEGNSSAEAFGNRANLMGDPGMDVWQGVPTEVQIIYSEETLAFGRSSFEVEVMDMDNNPLADMVVCAYQVDGIFERVLTNQNGIAVISLFDANAGEIDLTVSRPQYIPHQSSIELIDAESLVVIQHDNYAHNVVAGSENSIIPVLQNMGTTDISAISLSLIATEGFPGTIIDGTSACIDLSSGSIADGDELLISILPDVVAGSLLNLTVEIDCAEGVFLDVIQLSVVSILPEALTFNYNGNQILQPGDGIDFEIDLFNQGRLNATDVEFTLESSDPAIEIVTAEFMLSTMNSDAANTIEFVINIASSTFSGHVLDLDLTWSCAEGAIGQMPFQLIVGQSQPLAPSGPDNYGYYAYEDTDNNTLSPIYNWIEISSIGDELNLSDNGDEEDDATVVQLPIDFVYYGQAFEQMTICSNGYVAFSAGAVDDPHYRNHRLPSSTGPGGMIAPFWDDLISPHGANDSGVFVYHDEEDSRYVIQWNQMEANGSGGENTFQLVLYDAVDNPTDSGDSPILMQWQDFDDSQDNSTDFPHASIGFENLNSTTGLSFSNYGQLANSIYGLYSSKAILITTDLGEINLNETVPPIVDFNPSLYAIADEVITVHLDAYDPSGISSAILYWSVNGGDEESIEMTNTEGSTYTVELAQQTAGTVVSVRAEVFDNSSNNNMNDTDTFEISVTVGLPPSGPTDYGHYMSEELDIGGQQYDWIDITQIGTELDFGWNELLEMSVTQIDIRWFGEAVNTFAISTNGAVAPNVNWFDVFAIEEMGVGAGESRQISPAWCYGYLWSGGSVYYWMDTIGGKLVISWIDLPVWDGGDSYINSTFQMVIYDADRFETLNGDSAVLFQYEDAAGLGQVSVGIQGAGGNDGISYVYFGDYEQNAGELHDEMSILVSSGWVTSVDKPELALSFGLQSIFPNPFNPLTTVKYSLDHPAHTRVSVFNLLGQQVAVLIDEQRPTGLHQVLFDANALPSGQYFISVEADGKRDIRKVILLK